MGYFDTEKELAEAEAQLEKLQQKLGECGQESEAYAAYTQAARYWKAKIEHLIPAMRRINEIIEEE